MPEFDGLRAQARFFLVDGKKSDEFKALIKNAIDGFALEFGSLAESNFNYSADDVWGRRVSFVEFVDSGVTFSFDVRQLHDVIMCRITAHGSATVAVSPERPTLSLDAILSRKLESNSYDVLGDLELVHREAAASELFESATSFWPSSWGEAQLRGGLAGVSFSGLLGEVCRFAVESRLDSGEVATRVSHRDIPDLVTSYLKILRLVRDSKYFCSELADAKLEISDLSGSLGISSDGISSLHDLVARRMNVVLAVERCRRSSVSLKINRINLLRSLSRLGCGKGGAALSPLLGAVRSARVQVALDVAYASSRLDALDCAFAVRESEVRLQEISASFAASREARRINFIVMGLTVVQASGIVLEVVFASHGVFRRFAVLVCLVVVFSVFCFRWLMPRGVRAAKGVQFEDA